MPTDICSVLNEYYLYKVQKLSTWDQARPEQKIPNKPWWLWLILAGRGWGKTKTGAETVKNLILNEQATQIAFIGRTNLETRYIMVEGPSGILKILPSWLKPCYCRSQRIIKLINGTNIKLYSGETPDQLRGLQHDLAWCDELASWQHIEPTWDNLQLTLRLGKHPKVIVTTTPKPINLLNQLVKQSQTDKRIYITKGSTYDNLKNLSPQFIHTLNQYKGSTLEKQEIFGEILESQTAYYWSYQLIQQSYISEIPSNLQQIIIAVDPAVSYTEESDETGIITLGKDIDQKVYILDDNSGIYPPNVWSKIINTLYQKWKADYIISEVNQGGNLIETNLRIINPNIVYKSHYTTKNKLFRNFVTKTLYEQNKIFHTQKFNILEQQMLGNCPHDDRLDALNLGVQDLLFASNMLDERKNIIPNIRTLE